MTAVHKQLVLSRVFVFLIFLLAALSTVCCYGYSSGPSASSGGVVSDLPPGTPQWAIHVWPPHVDRAAPLETYRARLIAELGGAELPYQYISAEQIAALAINEFTAGHEWDAALLLSIASYRYHQTAIHAYRLGVASATEHAGQINLDAYAKLIGSEVQAYNRMYFVDELTLLTDKLLRGGRLVARQRQQQSNLQPVHNENRPESEAASSPGGAQQSGLAAVQENLLYLDLAAAYRNRLQADMDHENDRNFAFYYLSSTPTVQVQQDALHFVMSPFEVDAVRGFEKRFPELQAQVLQDLHYPRAETRSNAAIILGRVPTAANTAALQQAFAAETDARARLSLAYALLEHGQDQQLQPLYEPLKSCPSPNCDQAVQLLQWTSAEKKKMIDPTLIVPVLNNRSVPAVTRLLAAWLLHDFAYLNILTEESLDALLLASTETAEERVADKAIEGVRIATLLDRARVRQMLDQNHVARRALLIRLSDIATEEDLAYLESQYYKTSQQDDAVRSAIVAGIGRIPGQPAAQLLIRWFEKYPANRENIAFALINRNDIDPTQLARLAALANDVGTLVLKLQLQTADAIPSAKFLLRRGDINARIQTALIVGRVHLADVLDDLWDLASYRNYAYYPSDSFVRRAALSAILEIVVDQRLRQEIRETPTPSPAPTPTPSPTPTPVPPAH